MPTLRIQVDATALGRSLTALERTQLPFALSKAVNDVALASQQAIRAHYRTVFAERRPDFLDKQGAKIMQFAKKNAPTAILGIDRKADFLTKFEQGGPRPLRVNGMIAIPLDVRRNKRDIVTTGNRARNLVARLGQRPGAGGVFVLKQQRGALNPGIYQRTGRGGRGPLKELYTLVSEATIPASLQFEQTIIRTVQAQWAPTFERALANAVATAR